MTITDDLKKQAAKSNAWKWAIALGAVAVGLVYLFTGDKTTAYKILEVGQEIVAVKVDDGDIHVVNATKPVSVTEVAE